MESAREKRKPGRGHGEIEKPILRKFAKDGASLLNVPHRTLAQKLERAQETKEALLIGSREVVETFDHLAGFAHGGRAGGCRAHRGRVVDDGCLHIARATVVHEEQPLTESPNGRGAELRRTGLTLGYTVGQ